MSSLPKTPPALHDDHDDDDDDVDDDDDDDGDTQVIKQSGRGGDPSHVAMESTRAADHSVMGPDGSEYQTAQQQQQHVTDQLGNLSVHHGEACTRQGMI